jgi:hypothetical protein
MAPETPRSWPWPDALDAVLAAPGHHGQLLENDRVRVLRTWIAPGDTVPLHTLKNVGTTPIDLVSIEVKAPPRSKPRAGPPAKPGKARTRR